MRTFIVLIFASLTVLGCSKQQPASGTGPVQPASGAAQMSADNSDCLDGGTRRTDATAPDACPYLVEVMGPADPSGAITMVACCYVDLAKACDAQGCTADRCQAAGNPPFAGVAQCEAQDSYGKGGVE